MQTVIACNDSQLAAKLQRSLEQFGSEYGAARLVSHESAIALASASTGESALAILFASNQFCSEEFSTLERLCVAAKTTSRAIAVGPTANSSVILRAIRCGAVDYLDIHGDLDKDLRAIWHRLNSVGEPTSKPGKLYTVLSPMGGTGTSMLASNLAAGIALREKSCGLLDLQLRGGDLATLLKITPRHNLLSLAGKLQHLDRAMFDQALSHHESGIHLLASPDPFSDYRQITPALIQKIIQYSRARFQNVVVDLEDAEHAEQVRMLAASHRVIIPLRLDFVCFWRLKRFIEYLTKANISRDQIVLVANRQGEPKELSVAKMAESLKMPIDFSLPSDPGTVTASFNLGVPLVVASPRSKLASGIQRLADSLLGLETPCPDSRPRWLRNLSEKAASLLSPMVNMSAPHEPAFGKQ